MTSRVRLVTLAAPLALAPVSAFAHGDAGDAQGFLHGFAHPVGGLDHVLAMLAVGLFAALLGGRALWLVPAAFVAMMGAGGLLGASGMELPFVEVAIAASVIVLGVMVALGAGTRTAVAMGLAGFFALFHGHAHGSEMPVGASGLDYAIGLMLATAGLHAAGIGLAFGAGRLATRSELMVRAGGGATALAGIGMLTGLI